MKQKIIIAMTAIVLMAIGSGCTMTGGSVISGDRKGYTRVVIPDKAMISILTNRVNSLQGQILQQQNQFAIGVQQHLERSNMVMENTSRTAEMAMQMAQQAVKLIGSTTNTVTIIIPPSAPMITVPLDEIAIIKARIKRIQEDIDSYMSKARNAYGKNSIYQIQKEVAANQVSLQELEQLLLRKMVERKKL